MTLIEVLFALVILSGVMLALSRFGTAFSQATNNAAELAIASDLASARIEVVKAHGIYATLVSTFNGVVETADSSAASPSMSEYSGYVRTTAVTLVQNDSLDYAIVTVTVTSDVLNTPLAKTVAIAAF
jgi:type II secretory pathway pseudopilin PulG